MSIATSKAVVAPSVSHLIRSAPTAILYFTLTSNVDSAPTSILKQLPISQIGLRNSFLKPFWGAYIFGTSYEISVFGQ